MGADINVKLSGVSTCNSDVEDETFFSQEAFTSTLDENMGPNYDVLCTYASFESDAAGWTWDPETKVDRAKAEGNIAAATAPRPLPSQPPPSHSSSPPSSPLSLPPSHKMAPTIDDDVACVLAATILL